MPVRILVVDDEVLMEEMINLRFRREINKKQYEFHYAFNGREALDWLDNQNWTDIILCDINMPEMDGLALMDIIKQK